ncbi:MAG TPA: hypothetical protein VGD31_08910, partial [Sphingobacteriaceae bacterium]
MDKDEAQELITKYIENQCSPEEKALIERWYLKEAAAQQLPQSQTDFSDEKHEIWDGTLKKAGLKQKNYNPGMVWMA